MKTLKMMFEENNVKHLTDALELGLKNKNESPLFAAKVTPLVEAIFSVVLPLQEQNLLFNPEGKIIEKFTFEEFLQWTDLVSLKTLYFILKESNEKGELIRTQLDGSTYTVINLDVLRDYLKRYNIHEELEAEDFPIAHYNLHTGVASVIKELVVS
jgi:hypothetical protein